MDSRIPTNIPYYVGFLKKDDLFELKTNGFIWLLQSQLLENGSYIFPTLQIDQLSAYWSFTIPSVIIIE